MPSAAFQTQGVVCMGAGLSDRRTAIGDKPLCQSVKTNTVTVARELAPVGSRSGPSSMFEQTGTAAQSAGASFLATGIAFYDGVTCLIRLPGIPGSALHRPTTAQSRPSAPPPAPFSGLAHQGVRHSHRRRQPLTQASRWHCSRRLRY